MSRLSSSLSKRTSCSSPQSKLAPLLPRGPALYFPRGSDVNLFMNLFPGFDLSPPIISARGRKMPSIPCCTLGVQRSAGHKDSTHRRSERRRCNKGDTQGDENTPREGLGGFRVREANCGLRAIPSRLILWAPETKTGFYIFNF